MPKMTETEKGILLIDPDDNERTVLAHFLRNLDYPVDTEKNLKDAIERISQGMYGCLIMDVCLPEMKGYDAVAFIKEIDPRIKIILTTKNNSKRLEAKVRQQDIFFYFIKSFDKEEIKLAIQDALKNQRRSR